MSCSSRAIRCRSSRTACREASASFMLEPGGPLLRCVCPGDGPPQQFAGAPGDGHERDDGQPLAPAGLGVAPDCEASRSDSDKHCGVTARRTGHKPAQAADQHDEQVDESRVEQPGLRLERGQAEHSEGAERGGDPEVSAQGHQDRGDREHREHHGLRSAVVAPDPDRHCRADQVLHHRAHREAGSHGSQAVAAECCAHLGLHIRRLDRDAARVVIPANDRPDGAGGSAGDARSPGTRGPP